MHLEPPFVEPRLTKERYKSLASIMASLKKWLCHARAQVLIADETKLPRFLMIFVPSAHCIPLKEFVIEYHFSVLLDHLICLSCHTTHLSVFVVLAPFCTAAQLVAVQDQG